MKVHDHTGASIPTHKSINGLKVTKIRPKSMQRWAFGRWCSGVRTGFNRIINNQRKSQSTGLHVCLSYESRGTGVEPTATILHCNNKPMSTVRVALFQMTRHGLKSVSKCAVISGKMTVKIDWPGRRNARTKSNITWHGASLCAQMIFHFRFICN